MNAVEGAGILMCMGKKHEKEKKTLAVELKIFKKHKIHSINSYFFDSIFTIIEILATF